MRSIRVALLLSVVLGACGDGGGEAPEAATTPTPTATPTATATARPQRPTPLECLDEAGLMEPERRGSTTWRGFDPNDGTIVLVERYGSAGEALEAVRLASAVHADAAGRYGVTGALKRANSGATVRDVAACLRG
jgi:hypothetical protein